ncbi:hypothetical protein M011DRAFT_475229 [Sporormia fimetaria CBS 119925]|uniref:MARVEL domain-containing protein n=1 Tax=Sporormia fimetaria CBS 119925 TaxID=1340428 RepID=A0A6A6VH18_9PLEO|nr:hypothetical protein M011DRAFT_475229 [Sporormia fimetaria CBS 119925]
MRLNKTRAHAPDNPLPSWILLLRALQFLFSALILALTAYALSIYSGGPLKSPLISTLIISILTLIPILLLTTPLSLLQRRYYSPMLALLLDIFGMLYWLATFAALSSYIHIYRSWGRRLAEDSEERGREWLWEAVWDGCEKCREVWQTSVAVDVFAIIMFLLFLFTAATVVRALGLGKKARHGNGVAGAKGHQMADMGATGAATATATNGHHHGNGAGVGNGSHGTGVHTGLERTPVGQHIEPPYPMGNAPAMPQGQSGVHAGTETTDMGSGYGTCVETSELLIVPIKESEPAETPKQCMHMRGTSH